MNKQQKEKLHLFTGVDVMSNAKVDVLGATATQRTVVHLTPTDNTLSAALTDDTQSINQSIFIVKTLLTESSKITDKH